MAISKEALPLPDNIFDVVKANVDLRKAFQFSAAARQFPEGYWRDHCIAPDHTDDHATMLVFADGVFCPACSFRRSVLGALMVQSGRSVAELAAELLQGGFEIDPETVVERKEKKLNSDAVFKAHIWLLQHPETLKKVLDWSGFSLQAILHWKIGVMNVGVQIGEDPKNPIYENQDRISFPVFDGDRLIQVLYRKLDDEQLGPKLQMESRAGSQLINGANIERDKPSTVIICEGWGDVVAFWQLGYYAITSTNGAGHWNKSWDEYLHFVPKIYVTGDADFAGQKMIDRMRQHIYWARPLPPPFEYGTKGDWRDFVKQGGTKATVEARMKDAGRALAIARLSAIERRTR